MTRIVSGITSTGKITIGNYVGAIQSFIELQDENELMIFVANMHAITMPIDPKTLKENSRSIAAIYLACGLDPKRSTIFIQSEVNEHTQLGHILLCNTSMGELNKMTQFKDKSAKGVKLANNTRYIPTGLFTYPTLMAADILLYDPTLVPVGKDQKQHIELTRNIAIRMNETYKTEMFNVVEEFTPESRAKIMSLQDPTKKMSKSDDNQNASIYLLDTPEEIKKKIAKAKTDSENVVRYDIENKAGVSNLMTIYSAITNKGIKDIEKLYNNKGYREFKEGLYNALVEFLTPIQEKYNKYISSDELDKVLAEGAKKAKAIASKKLEEVQKIIGLS